MNALIDFFETLSGSILPWALLTLAAATAAAFAWLAMKGSGTGTSSGGTGNMSRNRNSNQSDAMRTMSEIQMTWAAKRNYDDTLHSGPDTRGTFAGWFADEFVMWCSP